MIKVPNHLMSLIILYFALILIPAHAAQLDPSLTPHIQQPSPGPDKETNWLPAPSGPFYMVLRMYWPGKAILNGKYNPPPLQMAE